MHSEKEQNFKKKKKLLKFKLPLVRTAFSQNKKNKC